MMTGMSVFFLLVALAVVYAIFYRCAAHSANQRRRKLFQERTKGEIPAPREPDPEKQMVYDVILEELASRLKCDRAQIRHSDHFDQELKFHGISFFGTADLDELDDFADTIVEKLGIPPKSLSKYRSDLLRKSLTVGELCELFCDVYTAQNTRAPKGNTTEET